MCGSRLGSISGSRAEVKQKINHPMASQFIKINAMWPLVAKTFQPLLYCLCCFVGVITMGGLSRLNKIVLNRNIHQSALGTITI